MEWNKFFRTENNLRKLSTWLVVVIVGIAILSLTGWSLNIFPLRRTITGLLAMEPASAYWFLFSGTAFLLLKDKNPGIGKKTAGFFLAGVVFILSLTGMVQAIPAIGGFFTTHVFSGHIYSLTPADALKVNFTTSFCFFFIALAIFTLHHEFRQRFMPAQFFAIHSLFAGFLSTLGVLYQVRTLSGNEIFNLMAIHSAGCFVAFSLAILFVDPRKGLMSAFFGSSAGSVTSRSMIPYAIVIPALLGYIRLYGHYRGLYSVESGVVFLVIAIIVLFNLLIWYNATLLHHRDQQRMASELALQESEHRFRLLVSNVTDYAIFMVDVNGIVLNWNEGASAVAGFKDSEIIGKPFSVLYQAKDVKENKPARNLEMAASQGHFEEESWRLRRNGERFWANNVLTAVYSDTKGLEGFVNITRDINQRKSDQEQIAYMARMIEDTTDAVLSTDLSLVIRTWNKAAETLYGYTPQEAVGRSMSSIFRITTPETTQEIIRGELKTRGYYKGEVNHTSKAGEPLTILISIAQTKTVHGTPDGLVMVCRDFSERKKMEENLRLFNRELTSQVKAKTLEYSNMLERVTDAFVAMDEDFRITYLNRRAAGMSNNEPQTLIGKTIWELTPELISMDSAQEFVDAMQDQEYRCNTAYVEKLGLWAEYHIYPAAEGLSVFVKDVTDRKKAEEALLYSEETRKLIIQSALDAIICFDLNDHITVFNSRAETCFGWKEEDVKGTCFDKIVRNRTNDPDFHWIDYLLTNESKDVSEGILEANAIKKDNTSFPIELTIVRIHQKGDEFYCAFIRDISIRKEAEVSLNRSFEEIRELASHLQHIREEERADIAREIHDELGQQLTAVKMDMAWANKKADALTGAEEVQRKLKGAISLIDNSIQSVRRIATDLHPSILDDLGLMAAIEWYSQEFERRSGIRTSFTSSIPDDKFPPGVAIALFRICQESLTNVSRHAAARQVSIRLDKADKLTLTIIDDGKGFDPAAKRQRKSLGLVGMKERAQMLGGNYEISSRPGNGTKIEVTIPSESLLMPVKNQS